MTDQLPKLSPVVEVPSGRRTIPVGPIAGVTALVVFTAACLWFAYVSTTGLIHGLNPPPSPVPENPAAAAVVAALDRQSEALVAGDEAGWLAPVDQDKPTVLAAYRRQYQYLRAMGVTRFRAAADRSNLSDALQATEFPLNVHFGLCAQTPTCPPIEFGRDYQNLTQDYNALLRWERQGDVYRIVAFELYPAVATAYRLPWLDAELAVSTGTRTVAMASPDLAGRLPAVTAAADAAAGVADKYALAVRPSRFQVYAPNRADRGKWFNGGSAATPAYTLATSSTSAVVVLDLDAINAGSTPLESVLRHEFGKVLGILAVGHKPSGPGFLIEGFADYVEQDGRPISGYPHLADLRRYVTGGQWDGDLESVTKVQFGPQGGPVYVAMGYLTWRCIVDRFGIGMTLKLVTAVFSLPDGLDQTNPILGTPWETVKRQCADYIRAAV